MWHFGKDSYKEFAGEKFEVAWEEGQNALMRVYTKDLKTQGTRIRRECQEYPNKRFDEAVDEKLPTNIKMRAQLTRHLVNREEQGKLIAQTSGAISMINESNYTVRSKSGSGTYTGASQITV